MNLVHRVLPLVVCAVLVAVWASPRVLAADDASATIQQLLDDAIRAGKPRVELPPGSVRVARSLSIQNVRGLTVDGSRTTLIFSDPRATALRIGNCQGLVLRGITFDYDPLPFFQGTITARADDGRWFDFEIHAGYPELDAAAAPDYGYMPAYVFEAQRCRWKRWVPDLYPRRLEIRDPRHGRLVFGQAPPMQEHIAVGDRVAMTKRTGCGIRMDNCENVRVEDLTFLASPGGALLGRYMRGDNYFRYTVRPGPAPKGATEPRLMSTNADAFNYAFATRGPTLEQCRFSFMGDDSVNLHGVVLVVLRQPSAKELLVAWPYSAESLAAVVPAGATVRRLRPGNFEVLGEAPLASFVATRERSAQDLQMIQEVWPRNTQDRGTVWRLTLAAPLQAQPGDLMDIPANNAPGFVIRNCTFEDHRARGLRIMASQGLIEDNTFRRIKMTAISLGAEYGFWREAGWVDHVTVRRNVLEDVCQDESSFSPRCYTLGAISVFGHKDKGCSLPDWPGNHDLLIEGNRIDGCTTAGIYVAAARDVQIRDNRLRHVLYHPGERAGADSGLDLRDPIDARHAVSATCHGNVITDVGTPRAEASH